MPIINNKGNKDLFIHIPKTGGQSLLSFYGYFDTQGYQLQPSSKKLLFGHSENFKWEWTHLTAKEVDKLGVDYRHKYAIIREPFERVVSEYRYKRTSHDLRLFDCTRLSFDDFVNGLATLWARLQEFSQPLRCHFIPQSNFVDKDTKIIRFNHLAEEVRENFGFKIPHHNRSVGANKKANFANPKTKKLIYKLYSRDYDELSEYWA